MKGNKKVQKYFTYAFMTMFAVLTVFAPAIAGAETVSSNFINRTEYIRCTDKGWGSTDIRTVSGREYRYTNRYDFLSWSAEWQHPGYLDCVYRHTITRTVINTLPIISPAHSSGNTTINHDAANKKAVENKIKFSLSLPVKDINTLKLSYNFPRQVSGVGTTCSLSGMAKVNFTGHSTSSVSGASVGTYPNLTWNKNYTASYSVKYSCGGKSFSFSDSVSKKTPRDPNSPVTKVIKAVTGGGSGSGSSSGGSSSAGGSTTKKTTVPVTTLLVPKTISGQPHPLYY